ncbi:MAG: aldo/keto reductase, partial [Anaerolineales bacterium]|nr:aldo/keto reductase [Anaerolineales bacterium]
MQTKRLGRTELQVSLLGAGLSEIGNQLTKADIEQASQVLNAALDGGINFLDTAACYGI